MHVTQGAGTASYAPARDLALHVAAVLVAAVLAGAAAATPSRSNAGIPISVNVIPIANTLPLDVGIKQGFFEKQGLDVKKVVLQSGNDIMLALANSKGEIGFAGGYRQ